MIDPTTDQIRRLYHEGTAEDCKAAGMRPWDAERKLWLIPTSWADDLPSGLFLTSPGGEVKSVLELRKCGRGWGHFLGGRFGVIGWGWHAKLPREAS